MDTIMITGSGDAWRVLGALDGEPLDVGPSCAAEIGAALSLILPPAVLAGIVAHATGAEEDTAARAEDDQETARRLAEAIRDAHARLHATERRILAHALDERSVTVEGVNE